MSVKEELEIYLITYNRYEKLESTLNKLLEIHSPVRDFNITILDNASTDNTNTICEKIQSQHPHLRYVRNKINVGLSGNIIKTMELASKKWLWTICDDDDFDWSSWGEIENALNEDYDIVHTTYTDGHRNETYPYLINEEAFIPTAIYNTKHITPLTMQNAYAMAYTLLPHHAIGCKVINEKGKIFVPNRRLVLQGRSDKCNFFRVPRKGLFHRSDNYQLLAGYIGAYQLIEDKTLRHACCDVLCLGQPFRLSMRWFLSGNGNYLFNIAEVFCGVNWRQRYLLSIELIRLNVRRFLIRRNRANGTLRVLGGLVSFKYKEKNRSSY